VQDVLSEGDEISVKVIEIDPSGKIRLSRKEILRGEGGGEPAAGRTEEGPAPRVEWGPPGGREISRERERKR
jgi:polyribonucleotide nucleotidyltransferase